MKDVMENQSDTVLITFCISNSSLPLETGDLDDDPVCYKEFLERFRESVPTDLP